MEEKEASTRQEIIKVPELQGEQSNQGDIELQQKYTKVQDEKIPPKDEQTGFDLKAMIKRLPAKIDQAVVGKLPIKLILNNDILQDSPGVGHPHCFAYICSALLLIPALITLIQNINKLGKVEDIKTSLEPYTPSANATGYIQYIATFDQQEGSQNRLYQQWCNPKTFRKDSKKYKRNTNPDTKEGLTKKKNKMKDQFYSWYNILDDFKQINLVAYLDDCSQDVFYTNFNQCTGKSNKIKLVKSPSIYNQDGDEACQYLLSEDQALNLVTKMKDFEFNTYSEWNEQQQSYWKLAIEPSNVDGKTSEQYTGSLEIETSSPIPNLSYRFFTVDSRPFKSNTRNFKCNKLVKMTDGEASDSLTISFIRNTFNVPNYADLFNLFGLGNFYGASGEDPPERVQITQWQTTLLDDTSVGKVLPKCNIDQIYTSYNMEKQWSTQITYLSFPYVESKMVSQVAFAVIIYLVFFQSLFLRRGINNLTQNLSKAIEDQNQIERNHPNKHIQKRAENMDKLEEIHDLLQGIKSDEVFKNINLDDKKEYERQISDELREEEAELATEEIQQYGTNWHFYKTSHQIKLLEETVLNLVRQSKTDNEQIKADKEKIQNLENLVMKHKID